jgi:hypothetical protein
VDRLGLNQVVVVENQDDPTRKGGRFVDQSGQNSLGRRWRRRLERAQHPFTDVGLNCLLQRRDQVGQEAGRDVVALVERELGDTNRWLDVGPTTVGPTTVGDPLAEQRSLAKADRGRDEGQPAVQTRIEALDRARARYVLSSEWRNV